MANFFDKAFNKIDNKQEPVRVVEDTTESRRHTCSNKRFRERFGGHHRI